MTTVIRATANIPPGSVSVTPMERVVDPTVFPETRIQEVRGGSRRSPGTFDAGQYLANYADLQAVFGTNTEAATIHYITAGYFEGRTDQHLL